MEASAIMSGGPFKTIGELGVANLAIPGSVAFNRDQYIASPPPPGGFRDREYSHGGGGGHS